MFMEECSAANVQRAPTRCPVQADQSRERLLFRMMGMKDKKGLDKEALLAYNIRAGSNGMERWPSGLWRWS